MFQVYKQAITNFKVGLKYWWAKTLRNAMSCPHYGSKLREHSLTSTLGQIKKTLILSLHTPRRQGANEGIAPLILNLGTTWR